MKQSNFLMLPTALAAAILLSAGCSSSSNNDNTAGGGGNVAFDAKSTIDNVVDGIVLPTYEELNKGAATLLSTIQALSDGGATDAELDAAQTAWIAARQPWEQSEGFLFGPVDSLDIDPSIDDWPVDTQGLKDFLAANPNVTEADIAAAETTEKGFHAIEWLLFGQVDDGATTNDQAATDLNGSELKYLVALGENFKKRTQLLLSSWNGDFNGKGPYKDALKNPAPGGAFADQGAVLLKLIGEDQDGSGGIAGIASEVGEGKIADPFGANIGAADTTQVESQYSWNSLTDFHNNIQSIMNVYTGKRNYDWQTDSPSDTDNGLFAFVNKHDPALAGRVVTEIQDVQQKLALIKGDGDNASTVITGSAKPFRVQIGDAAGRTLIQEAIDAIVKVKATLLNDVKPLLGKTSFAS
jgi:predicted lipoprotein